MAKYKDCYGGPGVVLGTELVKGQTTGASQFGKKAAELPIIRDYVLKTNLTANWLLALAVGETNCDWWDKAGLREAYYKILLKRHKGVARADLEADKPKIPDILTFNGSFHGLASGRHEYYEIKPDNDKGIKDGRAKLDYIESMYGKKKYNLPYQRGTFYPHWDPLVAQLPIEIKLPFNRAFEYEIKIRLRQSNFSRLRIYLQLRRPEDGLLLYKVCIEAEDDDKRRIRQKVITKALAKHVYATYVGAHFPQDFVQLEPEIGDFSYEGDKVPTIRCDWNVVDEIDSLKGKLESVIYTRGIGLPGDKFVVYCAEAVWQYLVRTNTVSDIWERIKNAARSGLSRVGQGAAWAQVESLFLEAEDAAGLARRIVQEKTLIDVEAMANILLAFVEKNPGTAIAIAVTPLLICGGVAALLEAGMLATMVGGSEAGVVASSVEPAIGSMGRVALAEEILLGTRVGAGVQTVLTPATVASTASAGGGNLYALKTALSGPALKTVAAVTAAAASYLLMSVHTQAYAMGAKGTVGTGVAVIPEGAALIAEHASGLCLAPALDSPQMKPPAKGKVVDLRNLASLPDPKLDMNKPFEPRPAMWARYLGSVTIV